MKPNRHSRESGNPSSPEQLLTHFDRIADAPDAVPRLRRFILDLAVRGRLVEQDPNDEPASELIRMISTMRVKMIKKGEAKQPKKLLPVVTTNILYDVPRSWSWVQSNDLWDFENGDRSKNYPSRDQLVQSGIPFVNAGHLVNGRVSMSQMNFIKPEKYVQLGGGKLRKGDQIYCLRGSLGKHAIYDHEGQGAIASSLVILRPIEQQCVPYLSIYLDSDVAEQMLRRFDNGSAQPNLSSANLRKFEIPLPPLAEQHRIVAKVDELMALCDRLEAARSEREATRDRLATASLARLDEPDSETFQDHARFALDALPALASRTDQIKQLRQTILNLAVRGKLVPQDPNDEPAAELLKRIASIRADKNRRKSFFTEVTEDEKSFVCPFGWQWSRFGEVFSIRTGFAFKSSTYSDSGVLVFRVVNFDRSGDFDLTDVKYFPEELIDDKIGKFALQEGEILMVMVGGTIGKTTRVGPEILPALLNQNMWRIRSFGKAMSNDFEYLLIRVLNQQIESLTDSTHGHFAMRDYELY